MRVCTPGETLFGERGSFETIWVSMLPVKPPAHTVLLTTLILQCSAPQLGMQTCFLSAWATFVLAGTCCRDPLTMAIWSRTCSSPAICLQKTLQGAPPSSWALAPVTGSSYQSESEVRHGPHRYHEMIKAAPKGLPIRTDDMTHHQPVLGAVKLPPVYVLGGKDDAMIMPHQIRDAADFFGTQAVMLPGLAHDVMLVRQFGSVLTMRLVFGLCSSVHHGCWLSLQRVLNQSSLHGRTRDGTRLRRRCWPGSRRCRREGEGP